MKEDKCKKHQFFHGRCITCREPIHHGLNKCMCDICHTPATKDDRCNKCNSPFQYHHNIHEVDGKIYHTGCKPACPMCKLREKEGYCKCSTHREDLDETIYNCGDFGCNKHLSTEETNFNEKWGDKPTEKLVTIIGSLAQDSDDSEWFSKDSYKRACKEVEEFVADKLLTSNKTNSKLTADIEEEFDRNFEGHLIMTNDVKEEYKPRKALKQFLADKLKEKDDFDEVRAEERQRIIDIVEGMKFEIGDEYKKRHKGKSWCPQCEDYGEYHALSEAIKKIKDNEQ